MNIFENAKAKATNACTNCMEKTKAAIKEFFDYLDCNHDGNISAENIYYGM
jgi:Ca2+-binding EF-hand superfamily protein